MDKLQILEQEISEIKERNARVEIDKAWETSISRKILIATLTYFVVVLLFHFMWNERPFVNAIIPTIWYLLSTLSIPIFKKIWIDKFYK